jgi:hypothetical protein
MANCPEFYSTDIKILQQSQSKMALEYLNLMGVKPTVEELWRVTEVFVQCCLHKQDDDLKKRIKGLDEWIVKKQSKNKV